MVEISGEQTASGPQFTQRYRALVLAMLLIVYTFNFLDRQILGILVQPIKAELRLTDTELGALGGIAFAILYSTLAIPLALVADRTSRSWVVTLSLTVWSAFTALCGLATGFWQLFLLRIGVGVGEAGGVAPSYAMISDYFPTHQRARALSIYSLGIPIGSATGSILGGYIAATVDWRAAFLAVGLAGVAVAPVFRLIVREPTRGMSESVRSPEKVPVRQVFAILAAKRSFWLMAFAAGCSSMCGYGLAYWMPSVLMRSFGLELFPAGLFMGTLLLVGGCCGVFLGGALADRLGSRDRGAYAKLPMIAWLITVPLYAGGLLAAKTPALAWALLLVPHGLNILWLGPVTTAVQSMVPPPMRATASATFLLVNNLIGLGLGSLVMGAMADAMKAELGDDALRWAVLAALGLYLMAATLMSQAIRPLRRDWWGGGVS